MKMEIDRRKTADNIYVLSEKNGMSGNALANKLELSSVAVWKWMNAATLPSLENIVAMCGIFECEITDIVAFRKNEESA